jgi:hypothetical protein
MHRRRGAAQCLGKAYDARGQTVISPRTLLLSAGDTRSIQRVVHDGLFRCYLRETARWCPFRRSPVLKSEITPSLSIGDDTLDDREQLARRWRDEFMN